MLLQPSALPPCAKPLLPYLLVRYALCCTLFWCYPTPLSLAWFSLPVCLCRVALFFLALWSVGRRPLLRAQDPQFFCAPSLYSLLKGFPVRLFFQLARLGFCALEVSVSLGGVVLEPV